MNEIQRTIVPAERYRSEELSPGVTLASFYPGGKDGPNKECLLPTRGGQTWSDMLFLGGPDDAFQVTIPDIRLPANQYWPLHWHDCWTAVLVLEGSCLIGDWWMEPGDVFLTIPSLEYGPLLIGPEGCRMFEIFAQGHLAPGGYAPEYHDHPTLQGSFKVFQERSDLNARNKGRQILPNDVEGVWTSRLEAGAVWNLGQVDDPERGVMTDTRLGTGERIAAHRYGDWHALIVLDGSLEVGGRTLVRDDFLSIAPDSTVADIVAGPDGVHILEIARTARGGSRLPA